MIKSLESELIQIIRQSGPIHTERYMSLCLTHPEYGYYMHKDPFGRQGDFITAPDISQLFGEMIGFWILDLYHQMGRPEKFYVVEVGPGRGTLMADALRIVSHQEGTLKALFPVLIEISPALRSIQKETLSPYTGHSGGHPVWAEQIKNFVPDAPVIVINNEFFDALPVHQFIRTDGGLDEVCIGIDSHDRLTMGRRPFSVPDRTEKILSEYPDCPVDGVIEWSPERDAALGQMADLIKPYGGAALIIDYGMDVWTYQSTLQAVKAHEKVSVLYEPGACDVTSLVDFGRLAARAKVQGVDVSGPVGQGAFLQSLGIDVWAKKVAQTAQGDVKDRLMMGLRRLISPDQMGILFRTLVLTNLTRGG